MLGMFKLVREKEEKYAEGQRESTRYEAIQHTPGSRHEGNEQGQSHTQKRVPDTNSSQACAVAARRDKCARGHTPSVEGEEPVAVA